MNSSNNDLSKLVFGHVNVRSLLKVSSDGARIDKLNDFILHNNVSVLALSETHLSKSKDDDEVNISGFQCFRRDRRCGGHGGVAFFVRDDLPVRVL